MRFEISSLPMLDCTLPVRKRFPLMSSLISFACPLLAFGAITANDVAFVSARLVDYHDQQELPVPRSAGLEELVGRNQSDRAASVISPQEPSDLPHRPLLRIEFRSPVDLRAVARRDATVFLHAYFCSHQDDLAVLSAPTIYADGEPIRAREQRTENSAAGIPGQDFKYYFYVNTLRKENRESRPPQMGFDLRVTAENICFYVTGSGASGLIYKSTIGVIPVQAILAALH